MLEALCRVMPSFIPESLQTAKTHETWWKDWLNTN